MLGLLGAITGAVSAPLSMAALPASAISASVSSVGIMQSVGGQQSSTNGSEVTDDNSNLVKDPRLVKFMLAATFDGVLSGRAHLEGMQVVLYKEKLYLDNPDPAHRRFRDSHSFSGFYLDYVALNPPPLGLVSTISQDPPELNWIYVDKNTLELKYGNKTQSLTNIVGPWDWNDDMGALTLEGWEGFVAVEESTGVWALYFDNNDDHLGNLRESEVLECSLKRILLSNS